jgi:hypothetical protein
MQQLNFPVCSFKFKCKENKYSIFDIVRKKYVHLNPEEWVRQHVIHFLIYHKNYPLTHLAVEKELVIHGLSKRTDILVFDRSGNHLLIVECKSPKVTINQKVFDQIARYNLKLNAKYLMVTNGLDNFFCFMDHKEKKYHFIEELPNY